MASWGTVTYHLKFLKDSKHFPPLNVLSLVVGCVGFFTLYSLLYGWFVILFLVTHFRSRILPQLTNVYLCNIYQLSALLIIQVFSESFFSNPCSTYYVTFAWSLILVHLLNPLFTIGMVLKGCWIYCMNFFKIYLSHSIKNSRNWSTVIDISQYM